MSEEKDSAKRHNRESAILFASFLLFMLIVISGIIVRLLPYLILNYRFEVGFDTGMYERFIDFYMLSDSWNSLPAYPSFPSAYSAYRNLIEPSFFVTTSLSNLIMETNTNWLFRYYLPGIVEIFLAFISFVAGRNLTGANAGGWLSMLLVTFSYVQINAVAESYYRQIFATILLIMSLVYMDKYLVSKKASSLALFVILASGTIGYHIAVSMLVLFAYLISMVFLVWMRNKRMMISVGIAAVLTVLLSAPAWISRISDILNIFVEAITSSAWRITTLLSGEGFWAAGGAIPDLFSSFPHILIGYALFFSPIMIFSILGYLILRKNRELHRTIPALSIIMWFYMGFWFYFGNRFLLNLDLLLCVIAPVAIIYLYRSSLRNYSKRKRQIGIVLISAMLVVPSAFISINSQFDKAPYIVQNIEAIKWIETNITREHSVIFAPDYLSANLIQLGYLMAVWDFSLSNYSLSNDSVHPMIVAEEFMVNAPSNLTYLREFFTEHPDYKEKEIYVLWGTWDLDRPLVMTKKLIPVDEYASSPYFRCVYHGYGEILYIYEYVGPFAF